MSRESSFCTLAGPFGEVHVAATPRGVCLVSVGRSAEEVALWLRGRFPMAELAGGSPLAARAAAQIEGYFHGRRREFACSLDLRGTPFQLAVWKVIGEVPYGRTCSYGSIAARIGAPAASRAVGRACGANPVSIIIPCHRIIGADGSLGGFGGGVELKAKLLAMERGTAVTG